MAPLFHRQDGVGADALGLHRHAGELVGGDRVRHDLGLQVQLAAPAALELDEVAEPFVDGLEQLDAFEKEPHRARAFLDTTKLPIGERGLRAYELAREPLHLFFPWWRWWRPWHVADALEEIFHALDRTRESGLGAHVHVELAKALEHVLVVFTIVPEFLLVHPLDEARALFALGGERG